MVQVQVLALASWTRTQKVQSRCRYWDVVIDNKDNVVKGKDLQCSGEYIQYSSEYTQYGTVQCSTVQ